VDLSAREGGLMAAMIIVVLWLGIFPGPLFRTAEPALHSVQGHVLQGGPAPDQGGGK
jgi:NADH:ubiquinone oxidoreductase subunit 4 (subunit M)